MLCAQVIVLQQLSAVLTWKSFAVHRYKTTRQPWFAIAVKVDVYLEAVTKDDDSSTRKIL